MNPTKQTARKILNLLSYGLTAGMGKAIPGQMCVEAVVCFALGEPHDDRPSCVSSLVRTFKITLNDCRWSSNMARARGLTRIALAQLGSQKIDDMKFTELVLLDTMNEIVPAGVRVVCSLTPKAEQVSMRRFNRLFCKAKTFQEALAVVAPEQQKVPLCSLYSYLLRLIQACLREAINSQDEMCNRHRAAQSALRIAVQIANFSDSGFVSHRDRDALLRKMASIGVKALIKCKSPGCKWLPLAR